MLNQKADYEPVFFPVKLLGGQWQTLLGLQDTRSGLITGTTPADKSTIG